MTATLPLSPAAQVNVRRWACLTGLSPPHPGERRLLHLTPMPLTHPNRPPQSTTLQLAWSGQCWQLLSFTNADDHPDMGVARDELCMDTQQQRYWRLQSGPLPGVRLDLLEHCLAYLAQQHRQGQLLVQVERLPAHR
jgi:hypothetical protein